MDSQINAVTDLAKLHYKRFHSKLIFNENSLLQTFFRY